MVRSDAVSERVRTAGIFGDVSADGACFLAGGIGREMQSCMGDGERKIGVHDTGLDDGELVFDVDFEDAIHAREGDDDAAIAGERASGEAGAGAASNDGSFVAFGELDDLHDVGGAARENDALRAGKFDGAVVFVEEQVFRTGKNVVAHEERLQVADETLIHGRLDARGPI